MLLLVQRLLALPVEITNPDVAALKETIGEHHWTFVRFAAPWCAYTQISEPKWNRLSEEYPGDVFFANVNCNMLGQACRDEFDVRGYPAFILFKDGEKAAYFRPTYPRQVDIFTEWLNRQLSKQEF